MDWKAENKRTRYIDNLTDEECYKISWLAMGEPNELHITNITRDVNGNNIPHVEIHFRYYENSICEEIEDFVGIFENLDIYRGEDFHNTYCQKEIFKYFTEIGLDENK